MNVEATTDLVRAVTARLKDEPQTVWLLHTQTKHGEDIEVFATEAAAREEAIRWWSKDVMDGDEAEDDPYRKALEEFVNGDDSAGVDGTDYWMRVVERIVRT
jgi:hypothetical protein